MLDNNPDLLAFKNGIVNLKTRRFRLGIVKSDFITRTIDYDYQPADPTKKEFLRNVLLKILNNNPEHLEYMLSIIGYCFIGRPNLEKSIYFCVDKTTEAKGDNGKTFLFDILSYLLPCYVYNTKGNFIEKGNTKIHKQLAMMTGMRLVWLDEFGTTQLDSEFSKVLGDGLTTENEVMFGTSQRINIMFKLFALTNNMVKVSSGETALFNRYKQISYGSHFCRTGKRQVEEPEKLRFIADTSLGDRIKTEYYNEVFALIIEYAHKYYTTKIPPIPEQFVCDTKQTQMANDEFGTWFTENCVLDENGRTSMKALIDRSGMPEKVVKEGMARQGLKYNRELKGCGKDHNGKAYRGGYVGVILQEIQEENEEMEDL
jgi:phage/plasmid-associated DNA primase